MPKQMNTLMNSDFVYQPTAHIHEKAIISTVDWYAFSFRDLPIQLFISLRPLGHGTMEYLKGVLHDFVELAEKHFRAPLSYLVSYERHPYPNLHMAVCSSVPLDVEWIERGFRYGFASTIQNPDTGRILRGVPAQVGEIRSCFIHFHVDWDVRRFEPGTSEELLTYAMKEFNFSPEAEFDAVNLDYFMKTPVNRKDRKQQARHQARLNRVQGWVAEEIIP
jgi:hypothetical protein